MKLVVQIPCLNEAQNLAQVVADVPKEIPGIDEVEILVIDDGSTDGTSEAARLAGVHHIVRLRRNQGLARVFVLGLSAAVRLGADVIVNFDADNQYRGADIPRLIAPILDGEADMVIGDREVHAVEHFSPSKRVLQQLGSWVVRKVSATDVPDATSGFRALSREAALRMNVVTEFTYTLETIIQAGKKHIPIAHVPITVNPERRPSRLFASLATYVRRSGSTLVRMYALYEPLKVFFRLGAVLFLAGALIGLRFLIEYLSGEGTQRVQSLILAAVLLIIGFQTILMGIVADLIGANRTLLEDTLIRVRELELRGGEAPEVSRLERPERPAAVAGRESQ